MFWVAARSSIKTAYSNSWNCEPQLFRFFLFDNSVGNMMDAGQRKHRPAPFDTIHKRIYTANQFNYSATHPINKIHAHIDNFTIKFTNLTRLSVTNCFFGFLSLRHVCVTSFMPLPLCCFLFYWRGVFIR